LLAENYELMSATLMMVNNVAAMDEGISALTNSLRELGRIAGIQINDVILSCVRFRRESIRPTLH